MHYVLRYVFYAIGILTLTFMCSTNPSHVHFADLVRLMQDEDWWRNVAMVALFLAVFDVALSLSSLTTNIAAVVVPERLIRKPKAVKAVPALEKTE
jgi:hypothetical protein